MKLQRKGEFLSTRVQYIPLGRIRPNPQQPRQGFDEVGLAELAASVEWQLHCVLWPASAPAAFYSR